jgi:hypothetical protein
MMIEVQEDSGGNVVARIPMQLARELLSSLNGELHRSGRPYPAARILHELFEALRHHVTPDPTPQPCLGCLQGTCLCGRGMPPGWPAPSPANPVLCDHGYTPETCALCIYLRSKKP